LSTHPCPSLDKRAFLFFSTFGPTRHPRTKSALIDGQDHPRRSSNVVGDLDADLVVRIEMHLERQRIGRYRAGELHLLLAPAGTILRDPLSIAPHLLPAHLGHPTDGIGLRQQPRVRYWHAAHAP